MFPDLFVVCSRDKKLTFIELLVSSFHTIDTATTSHICISSNMYCLALYRLIVVSSYHATSSYARHIYVPLFYLSHLIEDTAAAAIVCHPPPPPGGDTRSPSSLFDCCVIVMVCWLVCLCHRSDSAVKEPPLIYYCNSVINCRREGRSNIIGQAGPTTTTPSIYIDDDAVI